MVNVVMMGKIRAIKKSCNEIENDCVLWAKEIEMDYKPDLVIFVAKSGFLFAKPMSDYWGCRLVDIKASRPSNSAKDKVAVIKRLIPEWLVIFIITNPINYKYHKKKTQRAIEESGCYSEEKKENRKRILIVDDSVDTGNTMLEVKRKVQEDFSGAEVKIASYSVFEYSEDVIQIDFYRYWNTVVLTGTSRKSKEYDSFISALNRWQSDNQI